MGSEGSSKLPILNFSSENLKPGTPSCVCTRKNVIQALEEFGFFVANCEEIIPSQLHDATFGVLQELFALPTETKMKNQYQKPLNGYVGQIAKLPLHESLGIDDATSLEGTQRFTDLMWPNGNDRFRNIMNSYAKLAAELDRTVTRMIFESYNSGKYYDSYIGSTTYLLRLLKNRAPLENEPSLGFINHTDKSFTTILHQDGKVNGLEVETKAREWITVELSPSKFVVMAGDALMAWSNDRIQSPNHKVTINGKEDRYSLALFSFNNGTLQVPEELVDDDHPLKYKPFEHLGLLRFYRTDEGYKSKCPIKAYCGV
ncbi:probable inactive 2-oxoglutarate-dependent dioxygenase AOP2 [Rhodamnia argentea]|uniref:Probable inactive 2-oxoglutarate-dependent dioxygenase AOP2 n=1 Tax=Rhodamnia argentea TaxID=178133 RepID=A0A8B8NUX4_9MYRT|nr:probable inactive 2-oxoglutarate-dependent dioxygenase AOP2 [Rhodamnia argentea]